MKRRHLITGLALLVLAALGAGLLSRVRGDGPHGADAAGVWWLLAGWVVLLWFVLGRLAQWQGRVLGLLAPALLGVAMLYLWEMLVVGWEVPRVLLPAPHEVGDALVTRWGVLWTDFKQTAISVLAGYCAGCGAGFGVALLADRYRLIQRGLLPLAGLAGAVPIVGIAPIMVMWFGFGWESKAAVIVVMTFFPMLINTIAGLAASDHMQRDLMRSYGAGYWQTFFQLRLPAALPFIFNALKINSTLALIGAIVAEMFGSPISGMGFRISTEVYKMNVDIVWATIAVAALAGSLFYGLLALFERGLTFWHPSYRAKTQNR